MRERYFHNCEQVLKISCKYIGQLKLYNIHTYVLYNVDYLINKIQLSLNY